ncbi:MAG: prepilin-type N-terminal cleavage/methylation domain-containing protein [Gammaproteobacteria bacterium]|nr:prepilin-type N-terminal cleavage/methylation domain-containing protein [Gammaproteobacteria bacterium]
MNTKQLGFTLIELLIFIVLIGIVMGILIAVNVAFQYTYKSDQQTIVTNLAEQRMEIILEQKKIKGFDLLTQDPCVINPALDVCTLPIGYQATTTIELNWLGDTNYKVITVEITGKANATLKSLVAKY